MSVTPDDVRRIAELARLRLDDAEIDRFTTQLRSILAHVAQLDAGDAPSSGDSGGDAQRFAPAREDWEGADALNEPPARFAIDWLEGFFVVPRLAALDPDAPADEAS